MYRTFDPDIRLQASHGDLAREATVEIVDLLHRKPDAVIGLATGSTQKPFYRELVRLHQDRHSSLSFACARFVNLDEYVGLPRDSLQSFRAFMQEQFFRHVDADPKNIHIPDGNAVNLEKECDRYERLIRVLGGIDLQTLGIGVNGHIGFCEPGSPFGGRTHIARLAEQTRRSNAGDFGGDWRNVPERALTMGLGTILEARSLILLANGDHKKDAVRALLTAPLSTTLPATALRLHPDLKVFVDWDAFPLAPEVARRLQAASYAARHTKN